MKLTAKQKKFLKGEAHHLPVMVQVGKNGCSESVIKQIDTSLKDHELIKIKVTAEDQSDFKETAEVLASKVDGILVHTIGHVAIMFKQADKDSLYRLPA